MLETVEVTTFFGNRNEGTFLRFEVTVEKNYDLQSLADKYFSLGANEVSILSENNTFHFNKNE